MPLLLLRRGENGHICRATNSAADVATGEFVCLLDHDDELAPHALFAVAERLQTAPDADLIYSDEDKVDAAGRRYDPAVVEHIVSMCNDPDSGGRMIDNIVTNTLLPALSREFLNRSLAKEEIRQARVGIADGSFVYAWE